MAEPAPPLLELRGVTAGYGDRRVLHGVDLAIGPGEIVCLLGANGNGKTTVMNAIMGAVRPTAGTIWFDGARIDRTATPMRVRAGIAPVLEGRRLFARMSVLENLLMGAHLRPRDAALAADLDRVTTLFPRLRERRDQPAGTLSGGEQQMVAIARALMARPRLLCLDEPSMGLSPLLVEQVFAVIQAINTDGISILLVEQNAAMALSIAHRGAVLHAGAVVASGPSAQLRADPRIRTAYLGDPATD